MRIVAVSFSGPSSRSRRSIPLAHVGVNVLLHAHLARVRIALLRACHPVVGPAEERRRRGKDKRRDAATVGLPEADRVTDTVFPLSLNMRHNLSAHPCPPPPR